MQIKKNPRIAVIGAGAIGSLVGGILAHQSQDVTLIAKADHVAIINCSGLQIEGVAGDYSVPIKAAETLDFAPDLALIAVKNQDVHLACSAVHEHIDNIPVVMMQNGVASLETAAAIFGKTSVIGCTLLLNALFLSPGKVTYANRGPIVIGKPYAPNDAALVQLKHLLNGVAKTKVSKNILGVQWSKLLINAMSNSLDGMTGLDFNICLQHRPLRRIAVAILKESFYLLGQAGIRPTSLPGIPIPFFRFMIGMPSPMAMQLLKLSGRAKTEGRVITSTLQSLLKDKPTEIDFLNGAFVRLGEGLAIPTPINAKVVSLIHGIERRGRFHTPAELERLFFPNHGKKRTMGTAMFL